MNIRRCVSVNPKIINCFIEKGKLEKEKRRYEVEIPQPYSLPLSLISPDMAYLVFEIVVFRGEKPGLFEGFPNIVAQLSDFMSLVLIACREQSLEIGARGNFGQTIAMNDRDNAHRYLLRRERKKNHINLWPINSTSEKMR